MTLAEMRALLDEKGICYPAKARKAELEQLLASEQEQTEAAEAVQAAVVRGFIDKYDETIVYEVGDIITVTPERFAEMNIGKVRVEEVKR